MVLDPKALTSHHLDPSAYAFQKKKIPTSIGTTKLHIYLIQSPNHKNNTTIQALIVQSIECHKNRDLEFQIHVPPARRHISCSDLPLTNIDSQNQHHFSKDL